jgi:hypothetical protein
MERTDILELMATKRGFSTRQDFIYDAEHDHYTGETVDGPWSTVI